jgi:hypothetical protein
MKLIPEDRRYAAVLCVIIIGASLFLASRLPERHEVTRTTNSGRPIVDEDGKTLLWAGKDPATMLDRWWDMTDSPINPEDFDHGMGADSIASIDDPIFAPRDDSRWHERANSDHMKVIGVVVDGEPRAYPVPLMSRHELVNDSYGDTHLAVAY